MRIINYLFIASLAVTGLSCSKEHEKPCTKVISPDAIAAVDQTRLAADTATIGDYIRAHNIADAVVDPTGLRYVIHTLGTGKQLVCLQSYLKVTYSGSLMSNGDVFEEVTVPFQFESPNSLANVILGWQIGFMKLPVGSSATFYIPSGFAYGKNQIRDQNGNTIIPANSILIFDVELFDFKL